LASPADVTLSFPDSWLSGSTFCPLVGSQHAGHRQLCRSHAAWKVFVSPSAHVTARRLPPDTTATSVWGATQLALLCSKSPCLLITARACRGGAWTVALALGTQEARGRTLRAEPTRTWRERMRRDLIFWLASNAHRAPFICRGQSTECMEGEVESILSLTSPNVTT